MIFFESVIMGVGDSLSIFSSLAHSEISFKFNVMISRIFVKINSFRYSKYHARVLLTTCRSIFRFQFPTSLINKFSIYYIFLSEFRSKIKKKVIL